MAALEQMVFYGHSLARSLAQEFTLSALLHALKARTPYLFHSDQGSQYAWAEHTALLQERGVLISKAPTQNAVWALFHTLKE